MGGPKEDEKMASHLEALSPENYHRQKIQQQICDLIETAAVSADSNKLLLKDLQKLNAAFCTYNQFIDLHVTKAMSLISKTQLTERAIAKKKGDNKSLICTFIPQKQENICEGFSKASDLKRKN